MVSTRGVRYKFSEGERVLCYEPDPTKAKVLYDSKVLEVIESKDKRGRRTVEYLIHFQGWNSSWDRCVSEDFVLKDTEENRQLQRDLAEKSQLQLGAYLYRRERKKGTSTNSGSGPAKRPRHGFSDDGSSSSTQPDPDEAEAEAVDTDSSSGSASSTQPNSPPNSHAGRANIILPSALRDRLTFDYHLVVKRGRLSRLPASPCAAQILESFVKWFARAGAWNPPRARLDPHHKPDMLDVSCRLNLLREVADGLRVYFDFILRGHLLYKQEADQYFEFCGQYVDELDIKSEPEDEDEENQDPAQEGAVAEAEADAGAAEADLKSPIVPEYAHLPPDPDHGENGEEAVAESNEGEVEVEAEDEAPEEAEADKAEGDEAEADKAEVEEAEAEKAEVEEAEAEKLEGEEVEADKAEGDEAEADKAESEEAKARGSEGAMSSPRTEDSVRRAAPRSHNLARRLRSHKSAVSQSESEEPAPSTSGEQRTFETLSSSVGSSGSSLSESWARPARPPPAPPTPARNPLSQLLDKVAKWQLIPRENTEHLPCRVYGAIHLARLFVKLPDFLNATQMPDFKLKLILKHIDMFVQYLDEHNEWFGEMFYITDGVSRSH